MDSSSTSGALHSDPFVLDDSFARGLEGLYVPWKGASVPNPEIVELNEGLSTEFGFSTDVLAGRTVAEVLTGSRPPAQGTPLAQAYAGHQFGGFSPQLGDGRALLLGELLDSRGNRWDLHLKGSGPTPFSRGGDGKAVLGPVLREYLMGEAMHALGIPTTRALAALTTGESIRREGLQPGAVLARVASSHLRVGTFQFLAARGDYARLKTLADFAIERHDPDLSAVQDDRERYLAFLAAVIQRQAHLVAAWMHVGFIHGVMNTDNTTVSGETIDYGPCAFMDAYDPATVFSSIDSAGRYAFGNQPRIMMWNLARFGETLLPLVNPADPEKAIEPVNDLVMGFEQIFNDRWIDQMRRKLGWAEQRDDDAPLIGTLLELKQGSRVDHTRFYRALSDSLRGDDARLSDMTKGDTRWKAWLERWRVRVAQGHAEATAVANAMDAVNPMYVPRNHLVEESLSAASDHGDLAPFRELLSVLESPFQRRPGLDRFEEPAPATFGPYKTYCGT